MSGMALTTSRTELSKTLACSYPRSCRHGYLTASGQALRQKLHESWTTPFKSSCIHDLRVSSFLYMVYGILVLVYLVYNAMVGCAPRWKNINLRVRCKQQQPKLSPCWFSIVSFGITQTQQYLHATNGTPRDTRQLFCARICWYC